MMKYYSPDWSVYDGDGLLPEFQVSNFFLNYVLLLGNYQFGRRKIDTAAYLILSFLVIPKLLKNDLDQVNLHVHGYL